MLQIAGAMVRNFDYFDAVGFAVRFPPNLLFFHISEVMVV